MPTLETDPIDLRLTADGDLYLTDDLQIEMIAGRPAVGQMIEMQLELVAASGGGGDPTHPDFQEGEWFFDLDAGTRWYDVLGQRYNEPRARQVARESAESCLNVKKLESLSLEFDGEDRDLDIDFRASTEFGSVAGVAGLEF